MIDKIVDVSMALVMFSLALLVFTGTGVLLASVFGFYELPPATRIEVVQ